LACILGALWFWSGMTRIRAVIRPIYQRLGIVPEPEVVVEEAGEG